MPTEVTVKKTYTTKRGEYKYLNNAWCTACRKPMERHGENFNCRPCKRSTKIISQGERSSSGRILKRSDSPCCIHCHRPMGRVARGFNCRPCGFRIADRKTYAIRVVRKNLDNPACIRCREAMIKKADHWYCGNCHWSTQKTGESKGKLTFASRSLAITGKWAHHAYTRNEYPWCVRCKIRMARQRRISRNAKRTQALLFRCHNCGCSATAHSSKEALIAKQEQIIALLAEGYSTPYISAKLGAHHETIAKYLSTVERARCDCGKLKKHKGKCMKRPWQAVVEPSRSLFDDLLIRLNRGLQSGLPEEIRAELASMILLDIAVVIKEKLTKVSISKYLSEYKKVYPQRISIDNDIEWWSDRVAG